MKNLKKYEVTDTKVPRICQGTLIKNFDACRTIRDHLPYYSFVILFVTIKVFYNNLENSFI